MSIYSRQQPHAIGELRAHVGEGEQLRAEARLCCCDTERLLATPPRIAVRQQRRGQGASQRVKLRHSLLESRQNLVMRRLSDQDDKSRKWTVTVFHVFYVL
jgi:predicted GNAT family N-acyltransferase